MTMRDLGANIPDGEDVQLAGGEDVTASGKSAEDLMQYTDMVRILTPAYR
jgi:hypothetical protein